MNDLSKCFLGMALLPLPVMVAIESLSHSAEISTLNPQSWWVGGALAVFGGAAAWFVERAERKAIAERVIIDVRPNRLIVDGVELNCNFSSASRFIKSRDALAMMVNATVNEAMFKAGGKFFVARKSALFRIWPGELAVTDIELDALIEEMTYEFLEPVFEVNGMATTNQARTDLSNASAA